LEAYPEQLGGDFRKIRHCKSGRQINRAFWIFQEKYGFQPLVSGTGKAGYLHGNQILIGKNDFHDRGLTPETNFKQKPYLDQNVST